MSLVIQESDVAMLRIEYRDQGGNRAFNVLHYQLRLATPGGGGIFNGELASTVLPDLANAARLKLANPWAATASGNIFMTGIAAQGIHPAPRSALYVHTFGVEVAGAFEDEALPLQDSATILKRTAVGARWGIGRLFHVGLPEAFNTDGFITPAGMAQLSAFADALAEEISHVTLGTTYHWRPILWQAPNPEAPNGRITQLVSVDLSDNVIKTQRRRRPGKGI